MSEMDEVYLQAVPQQSSGEVMNAIETCELTRKFGRVRAVDAVTMEIPEGAVFGLSGANGAGKSTLLQLLVGHLKPASGSVSILGQPPHSPRIWDRLGYVRRRHATCRSG